MKKLWDLEALGIRPSEFVDTNSNIIENFHRTTRFENGQYVVYFPHKREDLKLPTNYRMCVAHFKQMLQRTPTWLLTECQKLLAKQEESGIIERAPSSPSGPIHYLPYKVLWRKEKPRAVYDASAKTKAGQSLNDQLHSGPSLVTSLVGLLIGFRLRPIVLLADIENMFLMVGFDEMDRDLVQFLWLEDPSKPFHETKLIVFCFQQLPFGVISSPYLAGMVVLDAFAKACHSANGMEAQWYDVASKSFYVDNFIISVDHLKEAVQLYKLTTSTLDAAGMNLREWISNNKDFNRVVPTEKRLNDSSPISVLGILWDQNTDTLSLKIEQNSDIPTKKSALAAYAQVYDPLGLLSPCTLDLKRLCWLLGYSWKQPLSPTMAARFRKLLSERDEIKDDVALWRNR